MSYNTIFNSVQEHAAKYTVAMKNLHDWWKWHNNLGTEKCPEVVPHSHCSADVLNVWLPMYVTETRNKEGKYCPRQLTVF